MTEAAERYYQPELGQALFGQPAQQYDGGSLLDAILTLLREELDRVLWNRLQEEADSPFSNTGATFDAPGISIHAYSWDEDNEQPWNLKCGDVEISWYKHSLRGTSINKPLTPDELSAFLDDALAAIRACDSGLTTDTSGATFRYCGTEYRDGHP